MNAGSALEVVGVVLAADGVTIRVGVLIAIETVLVVDEVVVEVGAAVGFSVGVDVGAVVGTAV